MRRRRLLTAVLACCAVATAMPAVRTAGPHFYPDDPIWIDRDTRLDASKVEPHEDTNGYDFVANTFFKPGDRRNVPAANVNTVDEVPDSSWFTNRIGRLNWSIAQITRGPGSSRNSIEATAMIR